MLDVAFAERVRSCLLEMAPFVEKKMFGGLGFLVEGKMAVGVSSKGQLIVRVEQDETELLIQKAHVTPMRTSGRIARGWVLVDQEALSEDLVLDDWVERGVMFALRSAQIEQKIDLHRSGPTEISGE